jgi:hypothetical protein
MMAMFRMAGAAGGETGEGSEGDTEGGEVVMKKVQSTPTVTPRRARGGEKGRAGGAEDWEEAVKRREGGEASGRNDRWPYSSSAHFFRR